jgi:hypothetical protein
MGGGKTTAWNSGGGRGGGEQEEVAVCNCPLMIFGPRRWQLAHKGSRIQGCAERAMRTGLRPPRHSPVFC